MGHGVIDDQFVTRIDRGFDLSAVSRDPATGQVPVPLTTAQIAIQLDPARRPDVLLRRRTPVGYQVNAWWMIGAFAGVSLLVLGMVHLFPGG